MGDQDGAIKGEWLRRLIALAAGLDVPLSNTAFEEGSRLHDALQIAEAIQRDEIISELKYLNRNLADIESAIRALKDQ